MLKAALSSIFILILLNARSQNFDSLLIVSETLRHDSERVNLFYSEGFSKRALDPQFAYQCAKQAEMIAQKISMPYYTAKAANLLGVLYYRKNDFGTAVSYHRKALNLRRIINDKRGIAISNLNLGNIYSDLRKFSLAEKCYLESLNEFSSIGDQKQTGNCLLNLGVLYADQQKNDLARNYFTSAIQNAGTRNDYELQAICLNDVSVININTGAYDEAIANCMNSLKLKDLMENEMEKADSYINLAIAYYKKSMKTESARFLSLADSLIEEYDYTLARLHSLKFKAEQNKLDGNFENAFHFLSRYHQLSDSLRKVNDAVSLENNFIESIRSAAVLPTNEFKFPFLYFNILLIILLAAGIILFYYKR